MRIQTAATGDLMTDPAAVISAAGPGLTGECLIDVRQDVSGRLDQLVAFEDDLTVHNIAVKTLRARPAATAIELGSDDYGYAAAVSITGLDEAEDDRYDDLIEDATIELFSHASLSHRAQRSEHATITGHGYTVTWDSDDQALTGTIGLTAAALAPTPPVILTDPALAAFIA